MLTRKEQPEDIPVIHVADEATQQTIRIWTAQDDFEQGEKIPLSALESSTTYVEQINAGTSQTVEKGMLAATVISKGSVITENMLLRPGQEAYREYLLQPDKIPFPIEVSAGKSYTERLSPGDFIDVILITSNEQNLSREPVNNHFQSLKVIPVVQSQRIISIENSNGTDIADRIYVTAALDRRDAHKMLIASRIGEIDVFKSGSSNLINTRVGDVLADLTSIIELRGKEGSEAPETLKLK
ncbi:RcpC/CpaB family pilus assembly protein [Endozoicomonadaceae bacterium StTr2]